MFSCRQESTSHVWRINATYHDPCLHRTFSVCLVTSLLLRLFPSPTSNTLLQRLATPTLCALASTLRVCMYTTCNCCRFIFALCSGSRVQRFLPCPPPPLPPISTCGLQLARFGFIVIGASAAPPWLSSDHVDSAAHQEFLPKTSPLSPCPFPFYPCMFIRFCFLDGSGTALQHNNYNSDWSCCWGRHAWKSLEMWATLQWPFLL